MKKSLKKIVGLVLTGALVFTGCSTGETKTTKSADGKLAASDVKVGFIYVGPVGDGGFTYSHDQGRKYLEEKTSVKTVIKESVPENKAEVEKVCETMIEEGCNVIVGTSFGFQEGLVAAAEEHKDVKFLHCSGYETRDNLGQYFGKIEEMRYLSGIVAGMKTKSNVIGYVGAMPIPEVIRGINAFTLGAQSVNPNVKVKVTWTNTWYDPSLEKEAAIALIDGGADVITQHQDTAGPQQAAEERGVFSIGYNTDMSKVAAKANMTSAIWNWGPYYVDQINAVINGNWKSDKYWGNEIVDLAPLTANAPDGAKAKVDVAREDIKSGKLKVFTGPLKDQAGIVKVEAGKTMSDDDVWNMDWFIQGVEGTIPKN